VRGDRARGRKDPAGRMGGKGKNFQLGTKSLLGGGEKKGKPVFVGQGEKGRPATGAIGETSGGDQPPRPRQREEKTISGRGPKVEGRKKTLRTGRSKGGKRTQNEGSPSSPPGVQSQERNREKKKKKTFHQKEENSSATSRKCFAQPGHDNQKKKGEGHLHSTKKKRRRLSRPGVTPRTTRACPHGRGEGKKKTRIKRAFLLVAKSRGPPGECSEGGKKKKKRKEACNLPRGEKKGKRSGLASRLRPCEQATQRGKKKGGKKKGPHIAKSGKEKRGGGKAAREKGPSSRGKRGGGGQRGWTLTDRAALERREKKSIRWTRQKKRGRILEHPSAKSCPVGLVQQRRKKGKTPREGKDKAREKRSRFALLGGGRSASATLIKEGGGKKREAAVAKGWGKEKHGLSFKNGKPRPLGHFLRGEKKRPLERREKSYGQPLVCICTWPKERRGFVPCQKKKKKTFSRGFFLRLPGKEGISEGRGGVKRFGAPGGNSWWVGRSRGGFSGEKVQSQDGDLLHERGRKNRGKKKKGRASLRLMGRGERGRGGSAPWRLEQETCSICPGPGRQKKQDYPNGGGGGEESSPRREKKERAIDSAGHDRFLRGGEKKSSSAHAPPLLASIKGEKNTRCDRG